MRSNPLVDISTAEHQRPSEAEKLKDPGRDVARFEEKRNAWGSKTSQKQVEIHPQKYGIFQPEECGFKMHLHDFKMI